MFAYLVGVCRLAPNGCLCLNISISPCSCVTSDQAYSISKSWPFCKSCSFLKKQEKKEPNPACPTTVLNLEQFPGARLCVHFIGCVFYSAGPM